MGICVRSGFAILGLEKNGTDRPISYVLDVPGTIIQSLKKKKIHFSLGTRLVADAGLDKIAQGRRIGKDLCTCLSSLAFVVI